MSDTGISEQIATLREQIAAAEVEIEAHRSGLKNRGLNIFFSRGFMLAVLTK